MSILDLQRLDDPREARDDRGGTSNLSVAICLPGSGISGTLCN